MLATFLGVSAEAVDKIATNEEITAIAEATAINVFSILNIGTSLG